MAQLLVGAVVVVKGVAGREGVAGAMEQHEAAAATTIVAGATGETRVAPAAVATHQAAATIEIMAMIAIATICTRISMILSAASVAAVLLRVAAMDKTIALVLDQQTDSKTSTRTVCVSLTCFIFNSHSCV